MTKLKAGDEVSFGPDKRKMTVIRFIVDRKTPVDIDYMYLLQGFSVGDPVCQWFDGPLTFFHPFKAATLTTILSS